MQHFKNLLYSVEITSYVFVEKLVEFLIKYLHLKKLQTYYPFRQFWESNCI